MATQDLEYRLQNGFNAIYKEVVNSQIVNPPYNTAYQDVFFFLQKRNGIVSLVDITGVNHDLVKYTDSGQTKYFCATESGANIIVYEVDLSAGTKTAVLTKTAGTYYRFHKILGGGKSVLDTGTASSGTPTTLVDTGKTRATNEFAGNYVYISSGTGEGQYRYIASNTADTITVSGWTAQVDSTSVYNIYEELVENIVVSTDTESYKYDGVSWETFIFDNYDSIEQWKSRTWYIQEGDVWYSDLGDNFYVSASNVLLISDTDIYKLEAIGDYLLVCSPNKIYVIKEIVDAASGTSLFVSSELVSQLGLYSKESINSEKGIYLMASNGLFYSMDIALAGDNIKANLNNQSRNIYTLLDNLGDEVLVFTNTDHIGLVDGEANSYELLFNEQYAGRLTNKYKVKIKNYVTIGGTKYILGDGFIGEESGYKDNGTSYEQKISFVTGHENIFSTKRRNMALFLFGKPAFTPTGDVAVTRHIGGKQYTNSVTLDKLEYFTDIADSVNETVGGTLIGGTLLGGTNELSALIADVEVAKLPLSTAGNIMYISLTSSDDGGLFFGGASVRAISHNNIMKTLKNTL